MKRLTYTNLKTGWKSFVNRLSYRQKIIITTLCGITFGLVVLFMYLLRMHTYIVGMTLQPASTAISCRPIMPHGRTPHTAVMSPATTAMCPTTTSLHTIFSRVWTA